MDWTITLKHLNYLGTPLGFIVWLIITAIIFRLSGLAVFAKFCVITALSVLWLTSTPWVPRLMALELLSNPVEEITFELLPDADAIIVYSWLKPFKKDSEDFRAFTSYRLDQAIQIYAKQQIPLIAVSSEYPPQPPPEADEITFTRAYLNYFQIPDKDIHIISSSRNTRESAVDTRKILDNLGVKKVILMESDLRMPRKYFSLKKVYENTDIEILPYSNRLAVAAIAPPEYTFAQWLPNVAALKLSTSVLHELASLVAYRLLNWI